MAGAMTHSFSVFVCSGLQVPARVLTAVITELTK